MTTSEVLTRSKQARSEALFLDLSAVGSQRHFVVYIKKGSFRPSFTSEKCCLRCSHPDVQSPNFLSFGQPDPNACTNMTSII